MTFKRTVMVENLYLTLLPLTLPLQILSKRTMETILLAKLQKGAGTRQVYHSITKCASHLATPKSQSSTTSRIIRQASRQLLRQLLLRQVLTSSMTFCMITILLILLREGGRRGGNRTTTNTKSHTAIPKKAQPHVSNISTPKQHRSLPHLSNQQPLSILSILSTPTVPFLNPWRASKTQVLLARYCRRCFVRSMSARSLRYCIFFFVQCNKKTSFKCQFV